MELNSVIHSMNESFAYKLDEHKYVIKLKVKKNDFRVVKLCYCEKYLRERGVPGNKTFEVNMVKVASTKYHDYYEAIISDLIGLNDQIIPALAIRYFFSLECEEGIIYYGNYKFMQYYPTNTMDMFNFVIYQADEEFFKTPKWSKGAIIYQIFPERYYPTDGKYCSNWFEKPMNYKSRTNGTLRGITQKVPYLKNLGIDCIYLNPIFLSNTSHRYDTIDYLKIDPLLGDEKDFKELVETLHKNGIKIILDLVFNHSSTNFFAFQDVLKNQENSKYKDWYFIREFPVNPYDKPPKYMSFSFGGFMPKLNTSNKECREYLLNVPKYYLEKFDVDGFRLDVADEVSHNFWKEFRKVCKSIKEDTLIMGEIWYESLPYLRGDEFDSIMNYTIFDGIRGLITKRFTLDEFVNIIERERGESTLNYYHSSNCLIGSHDTNRFYSEVKNDKNKFLLGYTLLLFLPGSPLIYYGDEIMMDGGYDPDCRRGMIFDDNYNNDVKDYFINLIKLKHLPALRFGELKVIDRDPYLALERILDNEKYLLICNVKDEEIYIEHLINKYNLLNNTRFDGHLKPYQALLIRE
jgi:glycosidase